MAGIAPVSTQQTHVAVPPSGNPSQSDTDAQSNNTETPTRGQYGSSQNGEQLSQDEQRSLDELQSRDREAARTTAGGRNITGGPKFKIQQSLDGLQYTIGNNFSTNAASSINSDAQATLRKAVAIQIAANAPSNPSSQDSRVAVAAARLAARARLHVLKRRQDEKGYPSDYQPPAIRAYRNLSGYFQRQATYHNAPVNVQA